VQLPHSLSHQAVSGLIGIWYALDTLRDDDQLISWTSFTFVWNELDQTGTYWTYLVCKLQHHISKFKRCSLHICWTVSSFCTEQMSLTVKLSKLSADIRNFSV